MQLGRVRRDDLARLGVRKEVVGELAARDGHLVEQTDMWHEHRAIVGNNICVRHAEDIAVKGERADWVLDAEHR